MIKQTVEFTVTTRNRVVTGISRSIVEQPRIRYTGKPMPWFDDSRLLRRRYYSFSCVAPEPFGTISFVFATDSPDNIELKCLNHVLGERGYMDEEDSFTITNIQEISPHSLFKDLDKNVRSCIQWDLDKDKKIQSFAEVAGLYNKEYFETDDFFYVGMIHEHLPGLTIDKVPEGLREVYL